MVKIQGLCEKQAKKLESIGFADDIQLDCVNNYDVEISEEVKLSYHFGVLYLSDASNRIEIDGLDFQEIRIV